MTTRSTSRAQTSQQSNGQDTVQGHEIELLPGTELSSSEQLALQNYYARHKAKAFMLYEAERFRHTSN